MASDNGILIGRRSAQNELPLTLSDDVGSAGDLRCRSDPVIVAVARSRAGRSVPVEILHILAVEALRAGLLEGRIALALPLHRTQLVVLPIVGQVPRRACASDRAARLPVRRILICKINCVRVIRIRIPESRRRDRHVHSFRLPIRISVTVPSARYPVVVQGRLRQRVHVLIRQRTRRRVRVEALLLLHYPIDRIFPSRLANGTTTTGASRAVARYDRATLHPPRRHRFRRHAVVLDRHLGLGILYAVERTLLLLPLLSLYCSQRWNKQKNMTFREWVEGILRNAFFSGFSKNQTAVLWMLEKLYESQIAFVTVQTRRIYRSFFCFSFSFLFSSFG